MPLVLNTTHNHSQRLGTLFAMFLMGLSSASFALSFDGDFVQGGMVVVQDADVIAAWQDDESVRVSETGRFLLGFGRDHERPVAIKVKYRDGREEVISKSIAPREFNIQRLTIKNKQQVNPTKPEILARIKRDNAGVKKARELNDAREDFAQGFIWPAIGPISGVYGSQRILNGTPKWPHYGVDIALPTGTPVVAPADAIVTFADDDLFYSGGTLIMDHGHKLSSSFLHLSKITVRPGQRVKQGQVVGKIGATGRVTGAHLDWRMNLRGHRIDPQLLVEPMPKVAQ